MDRRVDKLKLDLLGTPTVEQNGTELHFRTRKAFALLIYLAIEHQPKTREHLSQFLWADSSDARQMLRTSLAHLKQATDQDLVTTEHDEITLNPQLEIQLDTRALEDAAHALRTATAAQLAALLPLYRGEFLENFLLNDAPAFDDWVRARREQYHQQFSRVLQSLAILYQARGDVRAALSTTERWRAHDPLDENAVSMLMQLYLTRQDRPAALRVFENYRDTLKKELDSLPSPETISLAKQIARAAPAPRVAPGAASSPQQFIAATPLIGRATEFAGMANAWFRAANRSVQVIALQGEAGIGKTRLATEFAKYVMGEGADVLQGRAFEAGGQLPYQPLVDALRPRLERENAPDDLVSDIWLGELARLLPELRERYPDLPATQQDSPTRLYEAFARLVIALSERAPVLLLLDDVQWADTASMDALQYAIQRWRQSNARVALLFTLRAEAVSMVTGWFAEAARSATVTQISLSALSLENTFQLVQSLAQTEAPALREISAWLFRETNGQPFFLMETLKALLERGDLIATRAVDSWVIDFSATPARPPALSADLQQVVLARVNRLAPNASDLMTTASVLGSASDFEMLRAVTNIPENDALHALDDLLASGLLREADGKIIVGHDKIRDVVYASTRDTRRRILHRRAFEYLTAQHGSPAARAHHALAAGLEGHAFHAFIEAGDDALRLSAPRDAIAYYVQARALAQETLINPDLYLHLGRAYELTDEPAHAQKIYEELLEHARATQQSAPEAKALNRLAILAVQALDEGRARELATAALERATSACDDLLILETNWTLAQINMYGGDNANGLAYGQAALQHARALDQSEWIARSLNVLAYLYGGVGRVAEAIEAGTESQTRFAALDNRAMQVDSLVQVSSAQRRFGKAQDAIATARAAFTLSRETENEWGMLDATLQGALALAEHGDYGIALADARSALDAARMRNMPILVMIGYLVQGIIYRDLAAYIDARSVLTALLDARLVPTILATVQSELAAVCALSGDWQAAYEYARRSFAVGIHPLMLIRTGLPLETEALLRGGEPDAAHTLVESFRALVHGNPRYEIVLLRAQAVLDQSNNDSAAATANLERAAELAQALELPNDLWRIYAALGKIELAQQIIQTLASTIDDTTLRETLLTNALSSEKTK